MANRNEMNSVEYSMVEIFKWKLFLIAVHAIYNSQSTMESDDDDDCANDSNSSGGGGSIGGDQATNAQHFRKTEAASQRHGLISQWHHN